MTLSKVATKSLTKFDFFFIKFAILGWRVTLDTITRPSRITLCGEYFLASFYKLIILMARCRVAQQGEDGNYAVM